MNRILLLEDDESLIDGLVYSLKKNEFKVSIVMSVKEAKEYVLIKEPIPYELMIELAKRELSAQISEELLPGAEKLSEETVVEKIDEETVRVTVSLSSQRLVYQP